MKKLSKLFALLLTASALVFGFASCANGSSDDDSSVSAIYTAAYDENSSLTFKFYDDNTWEQIVFENSQYQTLGKGTYTLDGNFTNGSVTLVCNQFVVYDENGNSKLQKVEDYPPVTITAIDGKADVELSEEDSNGSKAKVTVTFIKQ